MSYLVLGVALLAGLLLAGQWFVSANPKTIVKVLKWTLIGIVVSVILFFLLTGRVAWAFYALPALLPWFMRARAFHRMAKNFSRMASGGPSGQQSAVESRFLSMTLDHDSGAMAGVIKAGAHAGRQLDELTAAELTALHEDYRGADIESARLLAAYLDRMYPDWRDEGQEEAYSHADDGSGSSGPMGRAEALRVLGLDANAGEREIKEAHHRLIAGLHPDKGGSAYLAAKINEARDVLLGG